MTRLAAVLLALVCTGCAGHIGERYVGDSLVWYVPGGTRLPNPGSAQLYGGTAPGFSIFSANGARVGSVR